MKLINYTSQDMLVDFFDSKYQNDTLLRQFDNMIQRFSHICIFQKSLFHKKINYILKLLLIEKKQYVYVKAKVTIFSFIISTFLVLTVGTGINFLIQLMVILILTCLGFHIYDIYLIDLNFQREQQIKMELPAFFDLLNLYIDSAAYENFPQALKNVANNMQGNLAKDIKHIVQLSGFLNLNEILDSLETRIPDPLIEELCSVVKLTQKYGGNLSDRIKDLANEAHFQRFNNAKESGTKASGALLIPLIIFHLPVLLIILLLPSIYGFGQNF